MKKLLSYWSVFVLCFSFLSADVDISHNQPIEETLNLHHTHENQDLNNANLKGEAQETSETISNHPQHDRNDILPIDSQDSHKNIEEYPVIEESQNIFVPAPVEENNITNPEHDHNIDYGYESVPQNLENNYAEQSHQLHDDHLGHGSHDHSQHAEPESVHSYNQNHESYAENGQNPPDMEHHAYEHSHNEEEHLHNYHQEAEHYEPVDRNDHHMDGDYNSQHTHDEHNHIHTHEGNMEGAQHNNDVHYHDHNEHDTHNHDYNEHHHHSEAADEKQNEQHAHGHSHHHGHSHSHIQYNKDAKIDAQVWIYSILSTLLISAAPILILFLVPVEDTKSHPNILKVLLSFAAGGLLGDAFLHLIPHSLLRYAETVTSGDDMEKVYHLVGFRILTGIVAFLLVEKVIRVIKGDNDGHHSHSNGHIDDGNRGVSIATHSSGDDFETFDGLNNSTTFSGDGLRNRKAAYGQGNGIITGKGSHHHAKGRGHGKSKNMKTSAYLNLAADFAHNFTDGLAIGASFLAGNYVGFLTTSTILLHEVPHEIGDFAILIKSGCSKKKAIMLQLLTAIGAVSGTICGLAAQEIFATSTMWILPFTAGGFIYIATVSILPELLENSSFFQSLREIIAMMAGIYLMLLILMFE